MKRILITAALTIAALTESSAEWRIAGDKIRTEWAEQVIPQNVWQEYPRPQLVRDQWMNLNGLWNYAITPAAAPKPHDFDGEILVPFAVESALSGVERRVSKSEVLWYEREFTIPAKWAQQRIMLNFGAVDWKAEIFVNDILAGSHTGGYTPFSVDITPALKKGGVQRLSVRVWDPTDANKYPIGKQRNEPSGIWYTPVTGIWQTVWIEPVPRENRILAVRPECSVERGEIYVETLCADGEGIVEVELFEEERRVAVVKTVCGVKATLPVPEARLWSPDHPFLYGLKVSITKDGRTIDRAESYAAMRNIDVRRDSSGHKRIFLNGKPIFMYGPLDQGWWPDGLYTAPGDEALLSDIVLTKELGFNTIRKHIKVEPARWYWHCDREGILVWQDMPSGAKGSNNWGRNVMGAGSDDEDMTSEYRDNYYKEWGEIIDALRFHPSIAVWVPFNEAWTQFDTEAVAEWTRRRDPSRLVNAASGGNMYRCGDIIDIHHYPNPTMPLLDAERVVVLGEYGGIGYPVEGHLWWNKRNWGYIQFSSIAEVTDTYVKYAGQIKPFIAQGMSAAIYTQTTDVEGEINGFVTYDRKVLKMEKERVRKINTEVINTLTE